MSRHCIGRATNDKEPRDTNFPGFTSTGFPIKSRVPPPHSILFSDTIKFPFARAKILTGLSKCRLDHFVSDGRRRGNVRISQQTLRNQYPGHPAREGGDNVGKERWGEKRICRGDRGWNQARQPTVLMSNFERGFCQPTWLTISLQSSNVTIGDPTVNGIKGGTICSKIDLYRFHVLILTTFDCFRCWWNVISWLSYSWLPLFYKLRYILLRVLWYFYIFISIYNYAFSRFSGIWITIIVHIEINFSSVY